MACSREHFIVLSSYWRAYFWHSTDEPRVQFQTNPCKICDIQHVCESCQCHSMNVSYTFFINRVFCGTTFKCRIQFCVIQGLCDEWTKHGRRCKSVNHVSGIVIVCCLLLVKTANDFRSELLRCACCVFVDLFVCHNMNYFQFQLRLPINHTIEETMEFSIMDTRKAL